MEHYSHREGRKMMGKTTNGYGTPFIMFQILLQCRAESAEYTVQSVSNCKMVQ